MSRVFFDTNLFIYLLEDRGPRAARITELTERMLARGDQLYTSALTLGEVLVKPMEKSNSALCRQYEAFIMAQAVVVPFDREAALVYAQLRQDRGIKPPDAMQLSCAAVARVDLFITNDDRLSRKIVPGVQFISGFDRAFF